MNKRTYVARPRISVPAAALAILFFLFAASAESAEDAGAFPSRPIEIIVPFAAGGGLDTSCRLLAKYAESELGQSINIVNKTAGGNIQGNLMGIRAAPDGYTLGAWGSGLVTDQFLVRNAPYTHKDVVPVCAFADDPEVIAVNRQFAEEIGIETLEDLFVHVRTNPGLVTIGMGGNWTAHDFLRLKMETQANVRFNRMPFLGGRPALQATADGNCNVATPFVSELLALLPTGNLLPLAVAFDQRLPQLPDVPTTVESQYPEMVQTLWRILAVPLETPPAVVRRLESAFAAAHAKPEYADEARRLGINPVFLNAAETAALIENEYRYYEEAARRLGIAKQ